MAITTPRKLLVAVLSTVGQSLEGAIGSLQGSGRVGQNLESFESLLHLDTARGFLGVPSPRSETLRIPNEILDYYGWVFCQGGFLNLHMTFEQFLTVASVFKSSGISPEYEESQSENKFRTIDATRKAAPRADS